MQYEPIGKIEVQKKLHDENTFLKIAIKRAKKIGSERSLLIPHHGKSSCPTTQVELSEG